MLSEELVIRPAVDESVCGHHDALRNRACVHGAAWSVHEITECAEFPEDSVDDVGRYCSSHVLAGIAERMELAGTG